MNWLLPVLGRMIVAHVIGSFMQKKIAGLPSRVIRIRWQFAICLILAVIFFLASGNFSVEGGAFVIVLVGLANSIAVYAQWRSIDLSLSQTALFTQADDIIAIVLGQVLLGEGKFVSWLMILGLFLVFAPTLALPGNTRPGWQLVRWVIIYSVIWGVAVVAFRHFAVGGLPLGQFMTAWYLGSLVGAIILGRLIEKNIRGHRLSIREITAVGLLALIVWAAMLLNYISLRQAPIIVVQPLFQVSEMVLPFMVGLFIFKEAKGLSRKSKYALATSFVGGLLVILGYQF